MWARIACSARRGPFRGLERAVGVDLALEPLEGEGAGPWNASPPHWTGPTTAAPDSPRRCPTARSASFPSS
jgi:hypothetical protein